MSPSSLVSLVQNAPTRWRRLALAVMVAIIAALSAGTLLLSGNSDFVSVWWPAAGVSVLAALMSRGNRWGIAVAIWAAATGSRLLLGQPLPAALAYGLANAIEAWLVASLLGRQTDTISLDAVRSAGRFIGAVLIGAVVMGLLGGIVVGFQGGDLLTTVLLVAPAHASAILVIAPGFLIKGGRVPRTHIAELALQIVTLSAILLLIFWPEQPLQLRFLALPVLVWAALRFGLRVVTFEMLGTALLATFLTGASQWGLTQDASAGVLQNYVTIQAFLIVYAATLLIIAAGRAERIRLLEQMAAREQLLRGGIVGSQIGLLLLEESALGSVHVIDGNPIAARLLQMNETPGRQPIETGLLSHAIESVRGIRSATMDWSGEIEVDAADRRLQIFIARIRSTGTTALLTVQVIDVTARFEAEKAVKSALENERATTLELRELNRQKEDFVSAVSHELRTPITSIIGFAEELEDSELNPTESGYLAVIVRNAHRLADLVEDLLELSRLSDRGSVRSEETTAIVRLLENCVEELGPSARTKGVSLDFPRREGDLAVIGAPAELTRIVTNLVTNAIKFTPKGGRVTLACAQVGDWVSLEVSDNGIGIPPDEIDRVLERFYRASSSVSLPGTGLGLAIVKNLVDHLGGTLALSSDGETGTQVLVSLRPAP